MRPYVVGGACHRVQQQLDNALSEGVLELSPELAAHVGRCPQCAPAVRETEALFKRLRSAPAALDLGPVPGVVDTVLQRIAAEGPATLVKLTEREPKSDRKRTGHLRWLLGQVAAIAAILFVAVGGLTYLTLKVNHAVGGAEPSTVVERWVEPLEDWTRALFGKMR
ncbi:MAG: hypothetical protein ACOY94_23130 [Bacillota bacterium]